MSNRSFLLGVLLGSIAGAVTSLLLAPQKGSDTGKSVSDAANSAGEKVGDFAANVQEKANVTVERIKQAI